jgi:predicted permease
VISALSGFALIGIIVLVGWAARRWAGLPENAEEVIGRVVYFVLNPCLLYVVMSGADLRVLFSEPLLVSAATAALIFGLYPLIVRGRDKGTTIMGSLAAGYVNANYIGIPIATYVLGDAALVVPIVIMQMLVVTPLVLSLLERVTTGHASVRSTVLAALRNPMIIAVALGVLASVVGFRLPDVLADPLTTIGHAAVPMVLIAFGMSLHGRRVMAPRQDRIAPDEPGDRQTR